MDMIGQGKISALEQTQPEGQPLQMDRMTQYRYRALDSEESHVG